jgi:hypothetical protein
MEYIKKYTVSGISYDGDPYTIEQSFFEGQVGNRCHFDADIGIPRNVAEDLVAGWNRATEMYARQDPMYRKPTYSIVEPQCASTAIDDIAGIDGATAFTLIKFGQWSLSDFEDWCLGIETEAESDGFRDGIIIARTMIESSFDSLMDS